MDLDDFESAAAARPASLPSTPLSAAEALEYLDGQWYTLANRRGRWMDLIGDYAGSETFVLDGDALLQHVLRDPLLALGRVNEPSFQLLHALYSLERILNKFKKREAVFEIVFWQDNRHLTIQSTPSDFVITSRMLARALLFKHLRRLDIPVHTFKDLSDPKWLRYRAVSKPMFVMTNDGGVLDDQNLAGQILTQRIFIFDLLSQGTSVTLLQGTEFRDSKIMSFIYEQRLDRSARSRLDDRLWAASHAAMRSLEAKEKHARHDIPLIPLISITPQSLQSTSSQESAVRNFVRNMLSAQGLRRPFIRQLVFAFAAHLLILPLLSVEERARPLAALHPELIDILLSTFLPSAFLTLEDVWSQVAAEIDVDGRVFLTLIEFIVKQPDVSFTVILGPEVYQRLTAIWSSLDLAPVHYVAFSSRFASNHLPQDVSLSQAPASSLLPFTHPLFSDELVSVDVHVEEHAEALVLPHLEFNTVFNDIYHWHNPKLKAILPTHLGGEDSKPLDEWQRRRQLRRDQRFMTRLQWQAETLTGALGVPLKQMVIPLVGRLPSKLSSNTGPRLIQEKPSKSIKKGKVERVSAAEKIRQENMAKKQLKEDESNLSWWQEQLGVMARKTTDQSIILMENYERNKRAAVGWLAVEMRLFRLHLEFMRWIDHPDRENAAIRDNASVLIMRKVKEIYERQGLFPAALKALASALSALGFSHIVPSLSSASPDDSSVDRSLNFKFIKLLKSKSGSPIYKFMRIGEDPIVWQLRLFGEFMDRSMDSASDARVLFRPDAWQRKVLDCLDENQSVLVVAPTSAGKTFISYYAMEKILRTSDDGILIYVAPTKALVNQIAAEVYARFKKELNGGSC
ncbi:hypothetical protein AcW1_009642 [Taiwanofungus camphoratus]|nr:hypothetical protein AcW1_009642 [Antrodia cinnamomea]